MRYALVDVGREGASEAADGDLPTVERIASGDRQALAELYARYRVPLFHYALQLTADHGRAEEVLQDVFVAVWQGAQRFERRSRVQAWLFGITRRRAWKARRREEPEALDLAEAEAVPAPDPDPEQAILERATYEQLAAAIEQVQPLHREILLLSYVHELTYQEIAEILRVPMGTVKSRLSNAKRAVRALVAGWEEGGRCD
ncbi:MAG TPA: sigma-70 family RNA polymerase sigma factor [Ktedonobacterales bacterium]|nr:sigma-70 family RNA polymerase sigma factor [Ktedonobacterales bacterium]